MGSVKVTVYGRIKPCNKSPQEYKVKYGDDEDQITFINSRVPSRRSFRFRKIFGEDATQDQVFESVATPVINNFFSGYNGTIFTYGQTGSGKTYTMTGDIKEWLDPGLIPRIIQKIFKTKRLDTVVTITFCEIYNEHIYDLIRTDRVESELTPVTMLTEANSGITNFRNLSIHTVKTAEEALQLFIRGDSNKMVAETGSNVRSSRSHVIFSIALEFPHPTQENLRLKPVLYLVDLAGSEKLSKCKTPLSNVSETRYINLSLHYLEQVLIALRQPGRAHIPYRNSLMTALLRNSLGGNSITVMIATFSVSKEDAEETTQTCRFAERIALIKNDVKLSELIITPEREIDYLKKENERLRAQLKLVCNDQVTEQLDEKDKEKCIEVVRNFIQDNDCFELPLNNVRRMEYCFRIMREEILKDKEFIECKDVKSKESQLESFRIVQSISAKSINSNDSQPKLTQDNKTFINKSLLKKKYSAEIPKVNITYEDPKLMEHSAGNGINVPKSNKETKIDNKVRFSNKINQDVEDLKVKDSNQLKKSFTEKKLKDSLLSCSVPKEMDSKSNVSPNDTHFKLDFQSEVDKETKNVISPEISETAINLTPLTEDLCNKNFESFDSERVEEEKLNLKTEFLYPKKISRIPSSMSNDFKAFTAKCVPLTGDEEVDEEIIKFYESRYQIFKNK